MKAILVGLGTLIHLLPHPFGMSSIGATALYAGARGAPRSSWAIPLLPLTLALLLSGVFEPIVFGMVFVGYALSTQAGRWLLARNRSAGRFGAAIALGAVLFFLVSNLSMVFAGFYPATADGLLQCYLAGLPFLGKALIADSAYTLLLFGLHHMGEAKLQAPELA